MAERATFRKAVLSPRMGEVAQIAVPVPYLGSVNVWLLPGEPLTLVDTGPANDEALGSLEQQR